MDFRCHSLVENLRQAGGIEVVKVITSEADQFSGAVLYTVYDVSASRIRKSSHRFCIVVSAPQIEGFLEL